MRILGLTLMAVALAGCSTTPPAVYTQASASLSPECLALFADDVYQSRAQGVHIKPIFAVAFSDDKKDMVCTYAAHSILREFSESNRESAVQRCEEAKAIWVYNAKIPLGSCEVFAEGNTIVYGNQP